VTGGGFDDVRGEVGQAGGVRPEQAGRLLVHGHPTANDL
jgi:hypothetical protein